MGEMPCLTLLALGGRKYCRLRLHRTPKQSFGKGQRREGVQKASHVLEVNAAMERQCGAGAAVPGTTCPLKVCCSGSGYCGVKADYCDDTCQSNCEAPTSMHAP
ncbi:glycoside hydrolase [Alternaria alternata]|nr:glycoside hydrolase [Alternaria alternata]